MDDSTILESRVNTTTESSYTTNTTLQEVADFTLPWWQQFIFYIMFVIVFIVAAGGNMIVIWIVLAHKRMRTVTNYFLVNLAVADVLISLLNTPFHFVFNLYQDWWFDKGYCKFSFFVAPCTISVSVLTFMAIAIDRNFFLLLLKRGISLWNLQHILDKTSLDRIAYGRIYVYYMIPFKFRFA